MKTKLTFIYGEDCTKCHFLKPHIEKYAEEHADLYKLSEELWNESKYKVDSIPMMAVDDGEKVEMLNEEGIIEFIHK